MKRVKRHKIKQELPETSTSRFRDQAEHDLAYYIHDRVELMHQVFSVIKPKELKAMAPECVHHISVDDLQELCTEELLGISSKRLCAILDGADPPTDTESSSSEHMETISLDSISSDDEVLSQHSSKKKHKHKKHKSKNKHKGKNSKSSDKGSQEQEGRTEEEDRSKASRAGLTVLELLELQARARAIRAQLQQDNAHAAPAKPQQAEPQAKGETSEDEVEIKEEPPEVVEISSEDEKPNIEDLPVKPHSPSKDQTSDSSKTVTKRVNDLIVTIPGTKQNKKIVLNRNKSVTATNVTSNTSEVSKIKDCSKDATASSKASNSDTTTKAKASTNKESTTKKVTQEKTKASEVNNLVQSKTGNNKSKQKKKQKKKYSKSDKEEDHDEITLQLSDTEKMDLLEDFDRKNYENFTSSSEDSESSSESESENETSQDSTLVNQENYSNAKKSQETDTNTTKSHENINATNDAINMNSQVNNTPVTVSAIPEEADISTSDSATPISENNKQEETAVSMGNKEASTIEDLDKDMKETSSSNKNLKDTSPSSSPVQNASEDANENGPKDKSPIEDQSSDKSPIIEIDDNKTPNVEVETRKTSEEIHTIADNQKHQVVQSLVIQVRNDNFKESESKETQQSMRSVIVRVENDNSESMGIRNESSSKATEKTKQIWSTVQKVNECEMKAPDKNESTESIEEGEITNTNKDLSEGEITDTEEQQVTQDNNTKSPDKSEVVCVSDEEGDKRKKKKKKEKKSKKEKKLKKPKSDFREGADQNFFREVVNTVIVRKELGEHENSTIDLDIRDENKEKDDIVVIPEETELGEEGTESIQEENKKIDDVVSLDDDDIYEILEISDDSSCYEVEGISVSKEPTADEIAALSAKIDEIHSGDVIIINEEEGEDGNDEKGENDTNTQDSQVINDEIESISWRDRYLGSKKVKRVLTTSNILNALRKKNKELKRKLEESKKKIEQATEGDKVVLAELSEFIEGSIEHFNTLEGSTKYVDPVVPEVPKGNDPVDANKEEKDAVGIKKVTKEMEKDAKQLLKMYKRLLKYNDMNKKKDPTKKKKKKHKKNKEKDTAIKEKENALCLDGFKV